MDHNEVDYRIRHTLRMMAWQRAKGEMRAILETFWDEPESWERIRTLFQEFIDEVDTDSPLA